MSLRLKVLGSVAAVTLAMLILATIVARSVIISNFTDLQMREGLSELNQARAAIEAEKNYMDGFIYDYSAWDDTYEYVLDRNREYEVSNLGNSTFESDGGFSVNAFLLFDAQDRPVFSLGYDIEKDEVTNLPAGLQAHLTSDGLLGLSPAVPALCGIIDLGDDLAMVVSRQVVNSTESLPSRGTLVAATVMTAQWQQRLSEKYLSSFTLTPMNGRAAEPDSVQIQSNQRRVVAQGVLDGVYGEPLAILSVEMPNSIMQTADEAFQTFVSLFIALSLIIGIAAAIIFEYSFVRRISNLNESVGRLSESSDPDVVLSGSDEVAMLSKQIQSMVLRLQIAENERVQIERLRVSGEMAAGVSHNLNNMLNGIIGPSDMLSKSITEGRDLELLDLIKRSASRAARLVTQLNQVVKPKSTSSERPISINEVVREAINIAGPRWRDEAAANGIWIQVKEDLQRVDYVYGNEGLLIDVIINLLFNAVDAMPAGGTITIKTFTVGEQVCVTVADTGEGMSQDVQLRVFEPFFTTKMSVGTGLGLATVRATIDSWGGSISLSSSPGEGSEFTVLLPAYKGFSEQIKTPEIRSAVSKLRILIVDDDEAVRRSMSLMLPDYEIETASTGKEAIDKLSLQRFDIALVDLGIPDISGDEVARQAKHKQNEIITILVTGWQLAADDPRCEWFDRVMIKPIESSAVLVTAIEEAISRVRSSNSIS